MVCVSVFLAVPLVVSVWVLVVWLMSVSGVRWLVYVLSSANWWGNVEECVLVVLFMRVVGCGVWRWCKGWCVRS